KSPGGFDCSGFVSYVYAQVGKSIPSSTAGLRGIGTRVSAADAKPGDLVMFSNINHVGIYAGNGMMYDAARPGKTLQYRKIFSSAVYFIRV
ncbi:MAG TPA: NlpC/P60 family protein, partial [Actinomycetales bacterium]|nr:NlpC/P60 family protein [Actinomycetales bacterium]